MLAKGSYNKTVLSLGSVGYAVPQLFRSLQFHRLVLPEQ